MPNPLMYAEDHFVLLEPGQPEEILTAAELLEKLKAVLASRQDSLPRDLQQYQTVDEQAEKLIEDSCEFELEPGENLQWYAVRLEK